ncbi:unnamed protein product [Peronospora destructor]|uniref:Uncharacterized protein n=1 Tax=Peronospora destructor TaxID=86335 RepID=A0AAV0SZX3_9STRA|nr:unnamed protein product [Peronospora destructor]
MILATMRSDRSVRSRRDATPSSKDTWSCCTSATKMMLPNFKQQQQSFKSDSTSDDHQFEQVRLDAPTSSKVTFVSVFRDLTFPDFDQESDSDYVPLDEEDRQENTESEEEEDDTSTEELFDRYQEEKENDGDADTKNKYRSEKHSHQADVSFRKRFGCAIDTRAHPETRSRLRRNATRYEVYKFVLTGVVIVSFVQLALVYSASLWAFSMVTWRELSLKSKYMEGDRSTDLAQLNSNGHSNDVSLRLASQSSQKQIPDYVRTGLHLCATLSRRVVKSKHDAKVTQHALRACDVAVKFASKRSREAIEAHGFRGDLLSLISRFDSADEDYKAARTLVLEVKGSDINPQVARTLLQDIDLKTLVNRWTQLYKTKRFKELRREVKARAVQERQTGEARAMSELAAHWLSAFKQRKRVLDVLTLQRRYTLRRLNFEALDVQSQFVNEATCSMLGFIARSKL